MLENKLQELIIEKFGSVRQFSIKIDIPYTTVDTILKRGIDNYNVGNVIKMCKALNISIDNLLDNRKIISTLSFDNAEFIKYDSSDDNIAHIPKKWFDGGKSFYGLKISGDSMYPKYLENDIVIFEKNEDMYIADNKDCAVYVNGFDAIFKKVKVNQNGITLIPYNQDNTDGFETTYYDKEQISNLPIKIIGIAKQIRRNM